jgi:hypothetical protein
VRVVAQLYTRLGGARSYDLDHSYHCEFGVDFKSVCRCLTHPRLVLCSSSLSSLIGVVRLHQ